MPFLLAERARCNCARSMRAVKGSLGHSHNGGEEDWKALARADGTSRRANGWAGEKVARSGRQSVPVLEEIASKLGRIN